MQREPATPDVAPGRAFAPAVRAHARRVSRIIVGVALCVAIGMWGFIVWSTWLETEVARKNGRIQGHNLATILADELADAFDNISAELVRLATALQAGPLTADHVRAVLASPGLVRPDTAVRVIAPDGRLVVSTLPSDPVARDVSRQPHFITHRDDPAAGLLVDPPDASIQRDGPRIAVSRRLTAADGSF